MLAAMLDDEALPIKCVSLNAVGSYDTHSDEHETLATNLGETIESVLAFQRDLEARGLDRPGPDPAVVGVRAPPAGKRVRHRPRRRRRGFLIGTRVKGEMVGEFPGLVKLDENENLVNTSDFRAHVRGAAWPVVSDRSRPRDPGAGTGLAGPSAYGPVPDLIV